MSGDTGSQVETILKAKPGAKWNRQRAIAQVCTGWSAAMVDLHGEVIKTFASQSEADQAAAKLGPESRSIFDQTSEFNQKLFTIFRFWNSVGPLKLDPTSKAADATTFSFDTVMDEKNGDADATALRIAWKETAAEVSALASWAKLSKYASTVLGSAADKADLETKSKVGKVLKKEAQAFVRSVKKSATDVKKEVDKALVKEEKTQQEADKLQGQADEATAALTVLQATTPAQVVPAVPRPEVLAFFKDDFRIPELVTFKTSAPKDFCHAWVKQCHDASPLKGVEMPYSISATPWLDITRGLSSVSSAFGRFMGEFLASDEYKSTLGKGSITMSGVGVIGKALRDIVYLPHSEVLKLSREEINKHVANPKQQGPN